MVRAHDHASEPFAAQSMMQLRLDAPPQANPASSPAPRDLGADPLSDVLRMVKLTGALYFVVDASSPWGIEVPPADRYAVILLPRAQHVVSYHVILEGSGWVCMSGIPATRFEAGDVLVFAHSDPYQMLSSPGQQPEHSEEATLEFFRNMAAGQLPFVVKEGGGGSDGTRYVCGYLGCDLRPFNPVLSTLPRFLHLRHPDPTAESPLDRLIGLTLAEAAAPRPGGECIRLRLSELMFVEVIRHHLEALPAGHPGWLAGLRDPAIGRVLSMLHGRPAHAWGLEELAREAGISRAALAERFAHLVGCPPLRYLTLWRMQIAARLLADSALKVSSVAHEVGYESEAAFSRAFRRTTGVPPAEWRRRHVLRD